MAKKLLETVPNYSEGRDMEKVAKIAACFKNRKNVRLLDCQTDVNHNRCVITAVGTAPMENKPRILTILANPNLIPGIGKGIGRRDST